jgi:dihydrofolate reductase
MRTLTYAVATSVDGHIASRGEAMDWLRWSEDASAVNASTWEGVDTILMGRKTFDFALRSGGTFGPLKTFVFSRSIRQPPKGIEVISDNPLDCVRRIKRQEGGGIILMGGGELASTLLEGGLVDELSLNIHPLLFGNGTRLVSRLAQQVELELVESRPLQMGCLFARYRVQSRTQPGD